MSLLASPHTRFGAHVLQSIDLILRFISVGIAHAFDLLRAPNQYMKNERTSE